MGANKKAAFVPVGGGKPRMVVVDVDNTLVFTDDCLVGAARSLLRRGMTKDEITALPKLEKLMLYNASCSERFHHLARPNGELMRRIASKRGDSAVVVLTGRAMCTSEGTATLLKRFGFDYDAMYLNPLPAALRTFDFKAQVLSGLLAAHNGSVEVYEDVLGQIDHFRRVLPGGRTTYYHVLGGSILRR